MEGESAFGGDTQLRPLRSTPSRPQKTSETELTDGTEGTEGTEGSGSATLVEDNDTEGEVTLSEGEHRNPPPPPTRWSAHKRLPIGSNRRTSVDLGDIDPDTRLVYVNAMEALLDKLNLAEKRSSSEGNFDEIVAAFGIREEPEQSPKVLVVPWLPRSFTHVMFGAFFSCDYVHGSFEESNDVVFADKITLFMNSLADSYGEDVSNRFEAVVYRFLTLEYPGCRFKLLRTFVFIENVYNTRDNDAAIGPLDEFLFYASQCTSMEDIVPLYDFYAHEYATESKSWLRGPRIADTFENAEVMENYTARDFEGACRRFPALRWIVNHYTKSPVQLRYTSFTHYQQTYNRFACSKNVRFRETVADGYQSQYKYSAADTFKQKEIRGGGSKLITSFLNQPRHALVPNYVAAPYTHNPNEQQQLPDDREVRLRAQYEAFYRSDLTKCAFYRQVPIERVGATAISRGDETFIPIFASIKPTQNLVPLSGRIDWREETIERRLLQAALVNSVLYPHRDILGTNIAVQELSGIRRKFYLLNTGGIFDVYLQILPEAPLLRTTPKGKGRKNYPSSEKRPKKEKVDDNTTLTPPPHPPPRTVQKTRGVQFEVQFVANDNCTGIVLQYPYKATFNAEPQFSYNWLDAVCYELQYIWERYGPPSETHAQVTYRSLCVLFKWASVLDEFSGPHSTFAYSQARPVADLMSFTGETLEGKRTLAITLREHPVKKVPLVYNPYFVFGVSIGGVVHDDDDVPCFESPFHYPFTWCEEEKDEQEQEAEEHIHERGKNLTSIPTILSRDDVTDTYDRVRRVVETSGKRLRKHSSRVILKTLQRVLANCTNQEIMQMLLHVPAKEFRALNPECASVDYHSRLPYNFTITNVKLLNEVRRGYPDLLSEGIFIVDTRCSFTRWPEFRGMIADAVKNSTEHVYHVIEETEKKSVCSSAQCSTSESVGTADTGRFWIVPGEDRVLLSTDDLQGYVSRRNGGFDMAAPYVRSVCALMHPGSRLSRTMVENFLSCDPGLLAYQMSVLERCNSQTPESRGRWTLRFGPMDLSMKTRLAEFIKVMFAHPGTFPKSITIISPSHVRSKKQTLAWEIEQVLSWMTYITAPLTDVAYLYSESPLVCGGRWILARDVRGKLPKLVFWLYVTLAGIFTSQRFAGVGSLQHRANYVYPTEATEAAAAGGALENIVLSSFTIKDLYVLTAASMTGATANEIERDTDSLVIPLVHYIPTQCLCRDVRLQATVSEFTETFVLPNRALQCLISKTKTRTTTSSCR